MQNGFAIRDGVKNKIIENKKTQTQTPDIDKLKGELRKEIKQEFQKKDKSTKTTNRSLQVRFERLNSGFNLYISKETSRTSN